MAIDDFASPFSTNAPDMRVRRAGVADAEAFARMMAEPEVYGQLLQMPYATADQWRRRLEEVSLPGHPGVLLVVEVDGEVVGAAGLHGLGPSPRRGHAMGLGLHVATAWHGRGVGAMLMQAVCDYADKWLGLLRLELTVYTDNERAQALYRRFGFVDEGVHLAFALRDGVYVDALSMARLNPDPVRGLAT